MGFRIGRHRTGSGTHCETYTAVALSSFGLGLTRMIRDIVLIRSCPPAHQADVCKLLATAHTRSLFDGIALIPRAFRTTTTSNHHPR